MRLYTSPRVSITAVQCTIPQNNQDPYAKCHIFITLAYYQGTPRSYSRENELYFNCLGMMKSVCRKYSGGPNGEFGRRIPYQTRATNALKQFVVDIFRLVPLTSRAMNVEIAVER